MKERWILISILALLAALNLLLLVIYVNARMEQLYVQEEAILRVQQLYRQEGYTFIPEIPRKNPSFSELKLAEADMDKLASAFLEGQEYDKSYIYGSKIQYDAGAVLLISDQRDHSIQYTDASVVHPYDYDGTDLFLIEEGKREKLDSQGEEALVQPMARAFASLFLGSDLYLEKTTLDERGFTFHYVQMAREVLYFFNRISVTMSRSGVSSASLVYWNVVRAGDDLSVLTVDEILMAQYKLLAAEDRAADLNASGTQEASEGEPFAGIIMDLWDGYQIVSVEGGEAIALPVQLMVLSDGRSFRMGYVR